MPLPSLDSDPVLLADDAFSLLSLTARATGGPRFVDLSKESTKVNIVREGFRVPDARLDRTEVERVLGELVQVEPKQTPRVVSQSIAAGTRVVAGSSIDLVLAPRQDIPVRIFEGVHADLRERSVQDLLADTLDRSEHRDARRILLQKPDPDELSAAEKETVVAMITSGGAQVDDSDRERDFVSAYKTMRYVAAYR